MKVEGIEEVLKGYPKSGRDSLIPILQDMQEHEGYISREAIKRIGEHLKVPASKIYGVATFYNQFRFKPLGRYHVQVCRGTACHIKGSARIQETLERILGITPGEVTQDGMFSLEVVACMGACGLSPVIRVDEEFYAKMTPSRIGKILQSYRDKESINEAA